MKTGYTTSAQRIRSSTTPPNGRWSRPRAARSYRTNAAAVMQLLVPTAARRFSAATELEMCLDSITTAYMATMRENWLTEIHGTGPPARTKIHGPSPRISATSSAGIARIRVRASTCNNGCCRPSSRWLHRRDAAQVPQLRRLSKDKQSPPQPHNRARLVD